jgi:CelD/BcsL family acetyltransferase involved in cellulose biosynthesis
LQVDIFKEFNPELEKIWCKFETEVVTSPFQFYSWLSHWQNIIGEPLHSVQPQVVLVKEKGTMMAIFPLGIRESFGVSILAWLGGDHSDYMGPLLNETWKKMEKDFPLCWLNIINKLDRFDVIHFQKQKEHIGTLRNPFVRFMSCNGHLPSYHANLNNSWKEHYEKNVKTKLRADSRRQRRRLAEFGEIRFEVATDKETKKIIIDKMIGQKSRRYRDTGVWDMLSVPENKAFYEKFAYLPDNHLKIHCTALSVGETTVATHVGIVDQETFYYLMPAHEGGDWERYSTGRLLLEHLMEWSIENKLKVFDLTGGREQYKKEWCDTETTLYETLEGITFRGKLYAMAHHTKQTVKETPWLGEQLRHFNNWLRNKGV